MYENYSIQQSSEKKENIKMANEEVKVYTSSSSDFFTTNHELKDNYFFLTIKIDDDNYKSGTFLIPKGAKNIEIVLFHYKKDKLDIPSIYAGYYFNYSYINEKNEKINKYSQFNLVSK